MSYLVVGTKSGGSWAVEVKDVGTTTSPGLSGIEAAARELLVSSGHPDGVDADLQLLLPDFEVDLAEDRMPKGHRPRVELVSGLILLAVVLGAVAYVITRVF